VIKNDRPDYLAENPMGSYHQSGTFSKLIIFNIIIAYPTQKAKENFMASHNLLNIN